MKTAISLAGAARIVSVLMGVVLSAQARSIGRPARFMCAFVSDNTLRVKGVRGTMVILR